jgi:anti-anti-sigma factor
MMTIDVLDADGCKALKLAGRLNAEATGDFEAACERLLTGGGSQVILDCTSLEYLSSAGLCVILSLGKKIKNQGGQLVLSVPAGTVRQIIDLSGFASLFTVCGSFDQARAQFLNYLTVRTDPSGRVQIIRACGRLDAERVPEFEARWEPLLATGTKHLVFDFSQLHYLSSAGLCSLLTLAKQLKAQHGKLAIYAPSGPVHKIFEIAGFNNLIPLRDSLDEAIFEVQ